MTALNPIAVDQMVRSALLEDVGHGDITTEAIIPSDRRCAAQIVAGEEGVVCGHSLAEAVFRTWDAGLTYEVLVPEGEAVAAGQAVSQVSGSARSILIAEQVARNFLQRMSGIATITRRWAESIKYYHARLAETRATTPGLRLIERYAVQVGGGVNHRFGLYDAILIKTQHVALAGGVRQAVVAARKAASYTTRIEVAVETLEQFQEALDAGAEIILLEGMDPESMKRAVELNAGRAILEASGNITSDTLEDVAKTGVDIISVSALTASVKALPYHLNLVVS